MLKKDCALLSKSSPGEIKLLEKKIGVLKAEYEAKLLSQET